MVTNGIVVRLEGKVEDLTDTVNSLAVTLGRFMEHSDDAITKLASAQLLTEEKVQGMADRLNTVEDALAKPAAAQLVTEQKLQRFLDSLNRGGDGRTRRHVHGWVFHFHRFQSAM